MSETFTINSEIQDNGMVDETLHFALELQEELKRYSDEKVDIGACLIAAATICNTANQGIIGGQITQEIEKTRRLGQELVSVLEKSR